MSRQHHFARPESTYTFHSRGMGVGEDEASQLGERTTACLATSLTARGRRRPSAAGAPRTPLSPPSPRDSRLPSGGAASVCTYTRRGFHDEGGVRRVSNEVRTHIATEGIRGPCTNKEEIADARRTCALSGVGTPPVPPAQTPCQPKRTQSDSSKERAQTSPWFRLLSSTKGPYLYKPPPVVIANGASEESPKCPHVLLAKQWTSTLTPHDAARYACPR